MTNVVAFPGTELPPDLQSVFAFTSHEIMYLVTTHLARQITEPTTPDAMLSFGVSDEGDGWCYCQRDLRRSAGWIDTTPVCRFEKTEGGVRGKFFQRVLVAGREVRESDIRGDSLVSVLDLRMRKVQKTVQTVLFNTHKNRRHRLSLEITENHLRRITVNRDDPDALKSINYKAVERVYDLFNTASIAAAHDVNLEGAVDG